MKNSKPSSICNYAFLSLEVRTKISSLKQNVLSSKYIYFNTQITLKIFEIFICYRNKCPQQVL